MNSVQRKTFCLNPEYSTTRMLTKVRPTSEDKSLGKVHNNLFLSPNPERQGQGGLRTKGYFKLSYKTKPLLSIITVVYNASNYLANTIESVLSQSYDNVEYVIIDGGSDDGTIHTIKKYEEAIDYWVSEPDAGISDAFNKGLTVTFGEWINFMNASDSFASFDVLEYFVQKIDHKADVIFGKTRLVDSSGKMLLTCGRSFDRKEFRKRMSIPHQSAFHNRKYFEQYGLFDKRFRISMDYELLRRKKSLSAIFIDKIVSNVLIGGVSETSDYLRLREARMVKRRHCSHVGRLIIEFDYWYALGRSLVKRALIRIGLISIARKIRQIESRFK